MICVCVIYNIIIIAYLCGNVKIKIFGTRVLAFGWNSHIQVSTVGVGAFDDPKSRCTTGRSGGRTLQRMVANAKLILRSFKATSAQDIRKKDARRCPLRCLF